MKINLYYVEGISRIDTPSFNTKTHIGTIEDQEEFFLTKLVRSIDTTFYPPYYQNSIKFDKEDLEITDNVNYLSLEYNGKTYYYFIDNINYTSTGIITLEVSMDTIQTFMFDIYISSGIIERKFINRWIDDKINRSYKRENVSDGLFQVYEHNAISLPESNWFIVGRYLGGSSPGTTIEMCGIKRELTYSPGVYVFAPYSHKGATIKYGGHTYGTEGPWYISANSGEATLTNFFIIPFSPFYPSEFNTDNRVLSNIKFDATIEHDYLVSFTAKREFNTGDIVSIASVSSYIHHYEYEFEFESNHSKNVLFNSKYMPVLLDENYIHLLFGSRSSNTSTPLYQYDFTSIYCCYYASILQGTRYYYISSVEGNESEDKYRTLVGDFAPINIDIVNDKYSQFNETNKYRWLEAIGKTASNAALLFGAVALKASFAKSDIAKIASSSLTPKRHQISKKGQRAIESIQRSFRDATPKFIEEGAESLLPITSQVIQDSNMFYAPDTIKQSSSNNDITSYSYELFVEIQRVNDYEQCAQYYHRNGYLVQEYITQVSNIFNSIKNRYYFDVLKMSLLEVHLHNVIEDEDTVGLIEERLETGLRLWNVKNSDVIMGDFTYDNVELDYLS